MAERESTSVHEPPSAASPKGLFQKLGRDPEGRMSFMQHLMELRSRIITGIVSVLITTMVTLAFYDHVFRFLKAPLETVNRTFTEDPELRWTLALTRLNQPLREALDAAAVAPEARAKILAHWQDPQAGDLEGVALDAALLERVRIARPDTEADVVKLEAIKPLGTMLVLMKVAMWAGLVLASPILLYEIWAFVAPGLKANEKRAIRPVLAGGVFCFVGGGAFCYYLVFPVTIHFLVWFDIHLGFQPQYAPDYYIDLLITFMLIFGAVFETPLVTAVLAKLGLLSPGMLTKYWRIVVLLCFILGSFFSPGAEIFSMLIMSATLLVLYAVSWLLAVVCYPRKKEAG